MAMVDFCYLTGHPENLPSCFPDWYEDSNDDLQAECSPQKSLVSDSTFFRNALNTKIENDKNELRRKSEIQLTRLQVRANIQKAKAQAEREEREARRAAERELREARLQAQIEEEEMRQLKLDLAAEIEAEQDALEEDHIRFQAEMEDKLGVHLDDASSGLSEADNPNDPPTEEVAASVNGSLSTDLQSMDHTGELDTPLIPAAPGELGPEYPDFPLWEQEKMQRAASTTSQCSNCLCRPLITFECGLLENPSRSLSLQQQKNTDLQLWLELEEAKVALLAEKLALEQSQTRELERQCEVAQKLLSLKSTINALDIDPIDPCRDKEIPGDPGKYSSGHADQRVQCLCGDQTGHESLAQCPSYNQLPCVSQRWQLLKNCNACFRCLKFGHEASTCLEGFCGIDGCKRLAWKTSTYHAAPL